MTEADDIDAQASAWIARCDARGSDHDPELAAWLIADPRHRAAYRRMAHAWERSQRLARLRPDDRAINPDLLAPRAPASRWRRLRGGLAVGAERSGPGRGGGRPRAGPALSLATAAGIAAAALLALWNLLPASSTESYGTGAGGLSRVVLADGSAVTMNADTALRVHFSAARRTITLLRGEAHFSVTHDPRRPFEVHAGHRIVVAVGTAFDVRLEPGHDVEVTVTEGRVALLSDRHAPAAPGHLTLRTITAGQDALLTTHDVTVQRIGTQEALRRLSWERRELTFDGQTLSQAVAEFDRYTNRRIVIDDPSAAALEIGGSFRALDVGSFTAALWHAFGISSRVGADGTIHLFRVGDAPAARLAR